MILQYYRNIMEIICLYIYCKLRDIEHKNIKNALSSNFDKSFIKFDDLYYKLTSQFTGDNQKIFVSYDITPFYYFK